MLIVSIIASAYVWYFIGMAFSLAVGSLLGITGTAIAIIFAWIGVGAAVVAFMMVVNISIIDALTVKTVDKSAQDFAELFEDIYEKGDDDN